MRKSFVLVAALLLSNPVLAAKGNLKGKVAMAKGAKVDISDAINKATSKASGKAIEVELKKKGGTTVWEIEVLADSGKVTEVDVDASTGDVVDSENQKK
jgi:uncharacterized membrane protein YkoI